MCGNCCRWIFCCFNCIEEELDGENPLEHIEELEKEAETDVQRVKTQALGRVRDMEEQVTDKVREVEDDARERVGGARRALTGDDGDESVRESMEDGDSARKQDRAIQHKASTTHKASHGHKGSVHHKK